LKGAQKWVDDNRLFALCPGCSKTVEVSTVFAQQYIERHGCQTCRDEEFDREYSPVKQASPA